MYLRFRIALVGIFGSLVLAACSSAPAEVPTFPVPTTPAPAAQAPASPATPDTSPDTSPDEATATPDEPESFPPGASIAGVDVGGLDAAAAREKLQARQARLLQPVEVQAAAASLTLQPGDIALQLATQELVSAAQAQQAQGEAVDVPLQVAFDAARLREQLGDFAEQTATAPALYVISDTDTLTRSFAYTPGRRIDVDTALQQIEALLNTPATSRTLTLALQPDPAAEPPRPDQAQLQQEIEALAAEWEGIVGLYLHDMQTQETLSLNADTVFSGASVMKVAILLFGYINVAEIDEEFRQAAEAMIIASDNLKANDILAAAMDREGTDGAYIGAIEMNDMLRNDLGFQHTYMNMPYEAWDYLVGLQGISIEQGPPQEGSPPYTKPDPIVRTTPAEMSRLFLMIEECRQGTGVLLEQYPQLSAERCQAIFDLLARNEDRARIVAGVPAGVRVEHKSGWTQFMHADVGFVRSPGGDYLIAIYLWRDVEELPDVWANPYIAALSHLVYTAYNPLEM